MNEVISRYFHANANIDDLEAEVRRAEAIAKLLDSQFNFGGVRFGIEAIIGLVPIAGDTVATLLGIYPVYIAIKYKLGRALVVRMLSNLGVNWAVGLTPLVGDVADVFIRANIWNVKLLRQAVEKKKRQTS